MHAGKILVHMKANKKHIFKKKENADQVILANHANYLASPKRLKPNRKTQKAISYSLSSVLLAIQPQITN